ncbi:MAG: diacylglycerol kinase [Rhodospirillaceae bacterium]|nr:diacylglycerol kinase [Rhodospirillaceae bacterium]
MNGVTTDMSPVASGQSGGGRPLVVIFNPTAGRRKKRRLAKVLQLFAARPLDISLERTTARGHAEALARDAPAGSTVVVAGGDGTMNEAVNGRLAAGGGRLALIPLGTANVLAAELGIGDLKTAAATVEAGSIFTCRPGLANGRGFVMMAGAGFDAHVVAGVTPRLKHWIGKGAYVAEMIHQLFGFAFPSYRVTIDGKAYDAASVVVARGHYYGGRFIVAPDARLDRPVLHVCLFRRGGRWRTVYYALALALGRLHRCRGIEIVVGRHVTIEGPAGDPVQGDGDIIARLPVTIELSPVAIELLRPAAS